MNEKHSILFYAFASGLLVALAMSQTFEMRGDISIFWVTVAGVLCFLAALLLSES